MTELLRNDFERDVHHYWDSKRADTINIGLGQDDGLVHHHFAVGSYDPTVLTTPPEHREKAIGSELHRMETRQVDIILDALPDLTPHSRVLDGGSGRGGTALLINRTYGCTVDGVNITAHHNEYARAAAQRLGVRNQVRFHDRNMADTGFEDASFDAVVTNETTMYTDVNEVFAEFARVLKPGGQYVLTTWCINDAQPAGPEAAAIDTHYHCLTHPRREYLGALLAAGLVPHQLDDYTEAAMPYWELRSRSELATGIEKPYLDGYRAGRVNYMRICSRKALR